MKGQNVSLQNVDAFRRLYDRAALVVYRYVYGTMGGSIQEVEDITAETFLRAWKARHSFEGDDEAAIGWLLQIAHNLVIDHYRRKKRHGIEEDVDELELSAPQTSPEERLLIQEQMHILQGLLGELAPEQREMIVLRYILDWPVKRIAEHLGILENTASVNIKRILQRIRSNWPTR